MRIEEADLPGVLQIWPEVFHDDRGSFNEVFSKVSFEKAGLISEWDQDNFSVSSQGVIRGLHYQWPSPQAKLVWVAEGEILDVAVDVRVGSPTFGKFVAVKLSSEVGNQFYIPKGFAHGFQALSSVARVGYKCKGAYNRDCEHTILWNDPALDIPWHTDFSPILSEKDKAGSLLKAMARNELPIFDNLIS